MLLRWQPQRQTPQDAQLPRPGLSDIRTALAARSILTPVAYMAFYTAAVACAFPGGIALSMAAGLLFGTVLGGTYAVFAITAGAVLLFLAGRSTLRPILERRAGRFFRKVAPTLEQNGFSYLLAVRLIPFTPFWLVNLSAALTGISLPAYALATFIGIAPITFVLASAGVGIGDTLEAGGQPGVTTLLRPSILIPLLVLAAMSLAPVAFRRLRSRRTPAH